MMNRQSRLWGALLLGALLLSGWVAYTGSTRTSSTTVSGMETMLQAADSLYAPASYAVVLQHSGPYRTARDDASFARLGDDAAREFGLTAAKPGADVNGHRLYSASGELPSAAGGRLEVALSGWADGSTNITVRWDAPEGAERDKLLSWARDAAARMERVGVEAHWMVTVRGNIGVLSPEAVKALKEKVRTVYKAAPVESYTDSGSEIVSYTSALLEPGVRSAAGKVNLQAALHRDSIYGTYKLTVASPMIASEL
ncbi:YwmB family TATA-box binding protein [Paenibacillus mesophilus]|uniref:YwmB family TATA-box binding protein n=1 Tax=Paenibacillus mesophilus TaxID=2582849 RepID=UPI00130530AF|nr:YwmB family TATA-box binding protein [Paenibacillus mesophilus]